MLTREVVHLAVHKARCTTEKRMNTAHPGKYPAPSAGKRAARHFDLAQTLALYLCTAFFLSTNSGFGQMMLKPLQPGEPITLLPGDAAVFESPEFRKDLPCTVTGRKAELGFDLRFHSGYDVMIPLSELSGRGSKLSVVFRVYAQDNKE